MQGGMRGERGAHSWVKRGGCFAAIMAQVMWVHGMQGGG